MNRTLAIFAKEPVPGRVKTRLSPPLSPEEAAQLYGCMLRDTLAKVSRLPEIDPYLFFDGGDGAADYFARHFGQLARLPQEGADLGERMENAFRTLFGRGYGKVAIIGTDSPDLPPHLIREAYHRLDSPGTDAVFGPSEDGGYYLIAMKDICPALFRDIPWSSGAVLAKSLERGKAAGIGTYLLPQWYDVDTVGDLDRPQLLLPDNKAPLTRNCILRWRRAKN